VLFWIKLNWIIYYGVFPYGANKVDSLDLL
jgi:hypothetical protein